MEPSAALASSSPRIRVAREDRSAESFASLGYPRDRIERLPPELLRRSYPSGCPAKAISPCAGDLVVDIGAGGGFDCILLERDAPPGVTVVGVDVSETSFRRVRAAGRGLADAVSFVVADGSSLPIGSGTADWVTANGLLCVVPEPERILQEIYRVLRPGGTLALGVLLVSLPRPFNCLGRTLGGIRLGRSEPGYISMLERYGFRQVSTVARHEYTIEQAGDLWGTCAATRRLLRWGRAPWAQSVAGRVIRCFHGVDLRAEKPELE